MVCGGGSNAGFMKENLIAEIYLDIEPIVFGKGIRLFAESEFETKLRLLEIKKLADNEIQLHYQVLK
jgi:dihydrofolate reductase